MSMAISTDVKENSISFNRSKYINLYNYTLNMGETYNESHTLDKKCAYLKLVANISVSDETLTTDDYKNVCIVLGLNYVDDDGNVDVVYEHFYPKYQHEVNNTDTYVIFNTDNKRITSVDTTVINNEDYVDSIIIKDLYLLYNLYIDEETVKEITATGGGSVVTSQKITAYNLEGRDFILTSDDKLIDIDLRLDEDVIREYFAVSYNYSNIVDIGRRVIKGNPSYTLKQNTIYQSCDGVSYQMTGCRCSITATSGSGIVRFTPSFQKESTIYGVFDVEFNMD
jgi:hypothetical protein